MKPMRRLSVAAAASLLLGLVAQTQALVTFAVPKKIAQKCDLVAQGETIHLDVYIYPDYAGVHYEGPMTGWTSSGVPVTAYGTITVRRGISVNLDWLTIGDSCDFGRVKASAIAFPF